MKPFNLEEAKAGKPVVTREGKKVLELYHFKNSTIDIGQTIVAIIEGDDSLKTYYPDGRFLSTHIGRLDLFMAEETKLAWINVYLHPQVGELTISPTYYSESAAIEQGLKNPHYIKTIKIEHKP